MYDYLIVGSGLYGAVIAHELKKMGKKCLVLEKRSHIGGNIYTENIEDIEVYKYGAHIFHTNNKNIWAYINQFTEFNNFINSPLANYKGIIYNLPFNMNTFYQLWGKQRPSEVIEILEEQRKEIVGKTENLEEQAISLVGRDVYEKLIRYYTEKQWGRRCVDLPPFIINRLPVRLTYDNNYFNDRYQGIPIGGYTKIIDRMLEGIEVKLHVDYLKDSKKWKAIANKIIYTGPIDAYFGYCFGKLEYRSIRFETEVINNSNYQGNAVVNFTDEETPFTRIIEHKHFEFGQQEKTVISKEYSEEWSIDKEPYYPINDKRNTAVCQRYKSLARKEKKVDFGGRLGEYKYYNMDEIIEVALKYIKSEQESYISTRQ